MKTLFGKSQAECGALVYSPAVILVRPPGEGEGENGPLCHQTISRTNYVPSQHPPPLQRNVLYSHVGQDSNESLRLAIDFQ